ncbi:hypothetical protein [Desulfocastanea catecholica]
MLFFGEMHSFRNGAKMCVGIDGVPRILFLDVRHGTADLHLNTPSLGHNRHLRREVNPVGYSQRPE